MRLFPEFDSSWTAVPALFGGGALEREVNFPSDVRERHFHWPGEGLAL